MMQRIILSLGTGALCLALAVPLIAATKLTPRQQYRGAVLSLQKNAKDIWYVDPKTTQRYCLRDVASVQQLLRDVRKTRATVGIRFNTAGRVHYADPRNRNVYLVRSAPHALTLLRQRRVVVAKKVLDQIPVGRACEEPTVVIVRPPEPPKPQLPDTPPPPQVPLEPEPPTQEPTPPPPPLVPPIQPEQPPAQTSELEKPPTLATPAQALVDLVNARRRSMQLEELSVNTQLTTAAQTHADDMQVRNYFSTKTPEGKSASTTVTEAGYAFTDLRMYIAHGYTDAQKLLSDWVSREATPSMDGANLNDLAVGYAAEDPRDPRWAIFIAESTAHRYDREFARVVALLADRAAILDELLRATNIARAACTPTSHPLPMPDGGCDGDQLATECLQALAPLTMNGLLGDAAQGHADDMYARKFFAHQNPDGLTPHERIKRAGYVPLATGENLACGETLDTVQAAIDVWLKSCPHRKALLSPNITEIGFGYTLGRPIYCSKELNHPLYAYGVYWVQNFGKPQ